MKTTRILSFAFTSIFLLTLCGSARVFAQGTAFSYQGDLNNGGVPALGIYDLGFTIYDSASNGGIVAGPLTNAAVAVSNGLFTVKLDFGAGVFNGSSRWMEINVSTNGANAFAMLTPRQPILAAPYAVMAGSASNLLGGVSAAQLPATVLTNGAAGINLSGTFIGNGSGLTNLSAGALPSNVALLNSNQVFNGRNNFAQSAAIGTTVSATPGMLYINSSSVPNLVVDGSSNVGTWLVLHNLGAAPFWQLIATSTNNGEGAGKLLFVAGTAYGIAGPEPLILSSTGATVNGTLSGNGGALTNFNINASAISSGTLPTAQIPSLDASKIGSGTLADARLSSNVPLLNAIQNSFSGFVGIRTNNPPVPLYVDGNTAGDGFIVGVIESPNTIGTWLDLRNTSVGGVCWQLISTGQGNGEGAGKLAFSAGTGLTSAGNEPLLLSAAGVTVNGTFNNSSDRNAKQDYASVAPGEILDKVTQLPVSEWSYKADPGTRHIGPVAQDFYATFNVGTDDKHIAPMDEGGIALAAIQGLNRKVDEKEAEVQALKNQNRELEQRLEVLERLVKSETK